MILRMIRLSGVFLGFYFLFVTMFEIKDWPVVITINKELIVLMVSSIGVGLFLIFPWRFLKTQTTWNVMYVMFIFSFIVFAALYFPGMYWSYHHGAFGIFGKLLIVLILLIFVSQFIALWRIRPKKL